MWGPGIVAAGARALNNAQEVSVYQKSSSSLIQRGEGLLVEGLGLVPISRGSKSIWSKNL